MLPSQLVSKLAARRKAEHFRANYTIPQAARPASKKRKAPVKKTDAEKKLLAEKRAEKDEDYRKALSEARDAILEHAKRLQARFGGHDVEYYQQEIIQVSRRAVTQRDVNGYSVYLHAQLAELNAGASRFLWSCFKELALTWGRWY